MVTVKSLSTENFLRTKKFGATNICTMDVDVGAMGTKVICTKCATADISIQESIPGDIWTAVSGGTVGQ